MKNRSHFKILQSISVALFLGFSSALSADSTEIFSGTDGNVRNNLLFILDNSGSMGWQVPGTGKSRVQVMQESFKQVMESAPDNVNVGLMRFSGSGYTVDRASGISFPVSPLDAEAREIIGDTMSLDNLPDPAEGRTVRNFLTDVVDDWRVSGGTPLVDALYEGALYYTGSQPYSGLVAPAAMRGAHPSSYEGNVSAGDAVYKSPIESPCQKNYIVLMSDGQPTYYYTPSYSWYWGHGMPTARDHIIDNLLDGQQCNYRPNGFYSGSCGPEISQFLSTTDHVEELEGDQTVDIFTVGFGLSGSAKNYLESLATPGGGAFNANNAEELVQAFTSIVESARPDASSFASPSYTTNQNNLLSNGKDLYIPIFQSGNTASWSGNLKKFEMNDEGEIVDQSGQLALDEQGKFKDEARDMWSGDATGADVKTGGAASKLDPAPRKVFIEAENEQMVELDKSKAEIDKEFFAESSPEEADAPPTTVTTTYRTSHGLRDSITTPHVRSPVCDDDVDCVDRDGYSDDGHYYGYKVLAYEPDGWSSYGWYNDCDGNKITIRPLTHDEVNIEEVTTCTVEEAVAQVTEEEKEELIDFVRGYDEEGQPRKHMGDMLHSKPLVYVYDDDTKVIFAGTNEGFIHAFDADTGVEKWAYMPRRFLGNQKKLKENEELSERVYGIDGGLTVWRNDANGDGTISGNDEFVYLIFGLRRGGRGYYALDITDQTKPKMAWSLGSKDTEFSELGQTWSKATLSKMRIGTADSSELVTVLVFGGGYDEEKDAENLSKRKADGMGRDVFIVNAETGDLIWSLRDNVPGASSKLKDSIPGDIRILDIDNNGALDRLYFADTGGNIWRVDMDADVNDSDSSLYNYSDAKLTHFADLGGSNADDRMFFFEPDVAMMRHKGEVIATISLGSGYRAHPLNETAQDRFYLLLDRNVFSQMPAGFDTIEMAGSDLVNVDTLSGNSILDTSYRGWYYNLPNHAEKVLAPSLTFMNKVIFTTFSTADEDGTPPPAEADVCKPQRYSSRAYVMNVLTGEAVADLDRTDAAKERSVVVGINEIMDAPQIFFRQPKGSGGTCSQGDCRQTVEIRIGKSGIPLVDDTNTSGSSSAESTDLTDLMPQMYWLNADTSDN